jgi:hypothetical protein
MDGEAKFCCGGHLLGEKQAYGGPASFGRFLMFVVSEGFVHYGIAKSCEGTCTLA